ncbi:CLUMA_CG010156, isoform A [Clunio marinus]|uniref:CLUMA_CG010156, isoform A n=1 Tax=Clunio marinus TaxID=568069 RepID=A0A1J1I8C9_9DIPT|nr:CLUMA_CG010156, isoform A [Clunio marinus]
MKCFAIFICNDDSDNDDDMKSDKFENNEEGMLMTFLFLQTHRDLNLKIFFLRNGNVGVKE